MKIEDFLTGSSFFFFCWGAGGVVEGSGLGFRVIIWATSITGLCMRPSPTKFTGLGTIASGFISILT